MNRLVLAGLLLCAGARIEAYSPEDEKDYSKSASKVKIVVESKTRDQAKSDPMYKEVVDYLENKENWEKMFKRIDDQLGIYRKNGLSISATVTSSPKFQAQARGIAHRGSGELEVSAPAMVEFTRAMQKRGVNTSPSQITEMFVTHELTHCLQQSSSGEPLIEKWPLWLIEGMACFAAEDDLQDDQIRALKQTGVQDLEDKKQNPYPRGRMFFKHFHETYGADKLKEFIEMIFKRTEFKKAAEKATDKKWDEFKRAELEWSKNYAASKGL